MSLILEHQADTFGQVAAMIRILVWQAVLVEFFGHRDQLLLLLLQDGGDVVKITKRFLKLLLLVFEVLECVQNLFFLLLNQVVLLYQLILQLVHFLPKKVRMITG